MSKYWWDKYAMWRQSKTQAEKQKGNDDKAANFLNSVKSKYTK